MPLDALTPDQEAALVDALRGAFQRKSLEMTLRHRMGVRLDDEVNTVAPFKAIVADLVAWGVETGSLDRIVRSALHDRPHNSTLERVAAELGVTAPAPVEIPDKSLSSLEKLVSKRSQLLDYTAFVAGMARIGRQICRIELPAGTAQGTGGLVGPDLLLTAFHVVRKAAAGPYDGGDVLCRFDYASAGADGRTCRLADGWRLADAPFAARDDGLAGAPAPTSAELDFALVRLAEPVGDDALDGGPRGWIAVPERPVVLDTDDFMLVTQHPEGHALKVAFGEVLGPDESGFRLRYDTSTEGGASGAPCFDLDLRPFGVHQAGGPTDADEFNQCVPLRHIVRHLQARREAGDDIPAFWTPTDA